MSTKEGKVFSMVGLNLTRKTGSPQQTCGASADTILLMKTTCRTAKGFTLVEIMIVVVIIGLLASMAIPAFQKVRQSSQDKAVMNNVRQLSAAADQYFLENGVSTVAQPNLVGATSYVKALNTVALEYYPDNYTQGITITVSSIAGVRTVTYAP